MSDEKIDLGYGWEPSSIEVMEETEEENSLSAQDQMVKAIIDKDIQMLQTSIKRGASLKVKLGKDKLAVFAFRYFDRDICDFLKSKSVSFKDVKALSNVCVSTDNTDALKWLCEQVEKDEDGIDKILRYVIYDHNGLINGAVNCVCYLTKNLNLSVQKGIISDYHATNFFFHAIQNKVEGAQDLLFDDAQLGGHKKRLIFNLLNNEAIVRKLRVDDCQEIEQIFSKNKNRIKIWKSQFPFKSSFKYADLAVNNINIVEKLGRVDLVYKKEFIDHFKDKKLDKYTLNMMRTKELEINNFLEGLIVGGAPLLKDIIKSKKGKSIIYSNLFKENNEDKLIRFLLHSTKEVKYNIIKHLKDDIVDWRDQQGNTILHYLAYTDNKLSKGYWKFIYDISPDLFFNHKNSIGVKASDNTPATVKASLEKMYLNSDLKDIIKERDNNKKRKM